MCEARSHGLELDEDGQNVWVGLLCTWFGRRSAEVPRVDQGIVCMHCYSERRTLVGGLISIPLCEDCLVVGLSQQYRRVSVGGSAHTVTLATRTR